MCYITEYLFFRFTFLVDISILSFSEICSPRKAGKNKFLEGKSSNFNIYYVDCVMLYVVQYDFFPQDFRMRVNIYTSRRYSQNNFFIGRILPYKTSTMLCKFCCALFCCIMYAYDTFF